MSNGYTADELLAEEGRIEKVPIRNRFVYSKDMGGTERDLWEQHVEYHRKKCGDKGYPHFRASLVIRTACHENGSLMFKPDQLAKVSAMPAEILSTLYDAGARLSRVTKEDAKLLGEDLTASEDSTSDSPAT